MEELRVIETTEGRQFKPWASREDVQAIEQAVEQAVQDPTSVTAVVSEIASGKQAIASAINAKGGTAQASESFVQLAEAISEIDWNPSVEYTWKNGNPSSVDDVFKRRSTDLIAIDDSSMVNTYSPLTFCYCLGLRSVRIRNYIGTADAVFNATFTRGNSSLETYWLDKVTSFTNSFNYIAPFADTVLLTIVMPSCTSFSSNTGNSFKKIIIGLPTYCNMAGGAQYLRDFQIKEGADINLNLSGWIATNVIAEGQSGIDELNDNFYNNLLTKLYDHSQDGQTRTLRIGWLANVSAENIAYANAKGWTLTT